MKKRNIIISFFCALTILLLTSVGTIKHRGIIRMIYGGDTVDFMFSGDTNLFSGSLTLFQMNGGVIIDSLNFAGSSTWFNTILTPTNQVDLSGFPDSSILVQENDTIGFADGLYQHWGKLFSNGVQAVSVNGNLIQVDGVDTNKIIAADSGGVNLIQTNDTLGKNILDAHYRTEFQHRGGLIGYVDSTGVSWGIEWHLRDSTFLELLEEHAIGSSNLALDELVNPDHTVTYDTTNQEMKYTEVATGTGLSWESVIDSIYNLFDTVRAADEIYARDSTIRQLIDEHGGGSSVFDNITVNDTILSDGQLVISGTVDERVTIGNSEAYIQIYPQESTQTDIFIRADGGSGGTVYVYGDRMAVDCHIDLEDALSVTDTSGFADTTYFHYLTGSRSLTLSPTKGLDTTAVGSAGYGLYMPYLKARHLLKDQVNGEIKWRVKYGDTIIEQYGLNLNDPNSLTGLMDMTEQNIKRMADLEKQNIALWIFAALIFIILIFTIMFKR